MVLDEFHIAQRHAVPISQRHAVAGDHAAIGVLAEHPSGTAGGDDHRARLDQRELSRSNLDRDDTLNAAVLDHEIDAEMLVEALDRGILDRCLEERVQHVKAGLVGGEPGPLDLHATESTHVDMAIRRPAPRTSPVLQLGQFFRAVRHKVVDDILLAQPVPAMNGVVEVILQTVGRLLDTGRAAFGSHRVAAHRINFRNQRDLQPRIRLCDGDCRPQACAAAAHDYHICLVYLHA